MLEDLSPERIGALLHTSRYGRSLSVLASTGSTNDDARRALAQGAADGHVTVADHQEKGRGSHGRTWSSPPGSDLYLSIVARVPLPLSELPPLTLAVGVAVAQTVDDALRGSGHEQAQQKWPNDVWASGKKIAGILVEGSSSGAQHDGLIIGIGLNVRRREFPDWLEHPATSLALEGAHADRAEVLANLLGQVEHWVDRFCTEGPAPVIAAVEPRLALRGKHVTCDDHSGVLEGLSPRGALLLRADGVTREIFAGTLRVAQ